MVEWLERWDCDRHGCGFSRPVCLDKVGSDVICLINGLTTSSSALIRVKLIVNRLTVWTFSLRAKSYDKTQNHVTKTLC